MVGLAKTDVEGKEPRSGFRAFLYVSGPVGILVLLFVGPMSVLLIQSFLKSSITGGGGFAGFSNYLVVLKDPGYLRVTLNTTFVATASMIVMLAFAIPLAYVLAFRMRRFEIQFLLLLVLADQLNPLIRIYAWRTLLGRNGVINSFLETVGVINHPFTAILFSKTAVIIVLSGTYVSYATIPIYAALKAVDANLIEAASDLGGGLFTTFRKILLPLAAPGIFVAIILVYIPLFSEFVIPALVGGTSGYMIGNAIQQQILESGNWGVGSAMSFMLLIVSALMAIAAYSLGRVRRLETAT